MEPIRVLVTGVNGCVGQGIIKALRENPLPVHITAADISPFGAGLYWGDDFIAVPPVEKDGALESIISALNAHRIDAVLIGSEYDLLFFANHHQVIEKETGAVIVVAPAETIECAGDKWRTAELMAKKDLPFATTALPENLDQATAIAGDWGYPVIIKSRTGTSSRDVFMIANAAELQRAFEKVRDPIIQRPAGTPSSRLHQEYTCSVFRCANGNVLGPFTARRTLKNGDSWVVEVGDFATLKPLLLDLAERLDFIGPLNVQLMNGADGPTPFEINARFSGTTAIRAHFGFNETEFALRSFVLKETIEQPTIGTGVSVRYLEEFYLDGATANSLGDAFDARGRGTA